MHRLISLCISIILIGLLAACNSKPDQAFRPPTDPQVNAELGRLFMAQNKLLPGVHVLPNGLQYSVVRYGSGVRPGPQDMVTFLYQGQYVNGVVFDNQHALKNPVTMRVSATIPGWQAALQLMPPGSIWDLVIPPNLAFGEKGLPGIIGPNQTLVYRVSLLSVKAS